MKIRPFLLAIIFVSLFCFWKVDFNKRILASEEELAAWELKKKTESKRRIFPILVPGEKRQRFIIQQPQSTARPLLIMKANGEVVLGPEIIQEIRDTVRRILLEEQKPGFILGIQNNILGAMPPPGSFVIDDPDGPGTITVIPQLRLISPSQARTFRMKEDDE